MTVDAKVSPVSIEQLIKESDLIVVGKVSEIHRVGGIDFANVEISKTLKGGPRTSVVYSAEKAWPCDMSDAVEAETALFFFTKYQIGPGFGRNAEQAFLLKESVAELFNVNDLYRLSFDGRGRMPVNILPGYETLSINPGVILPRAFSHNLSDVIEFTKKLLADS